jgi:DNA-directed RNA polymerase subunit beta
LDEKYFLRPHLRRTNQDTCINLTPSKKGERRGARYCEGYGTNQGELALGRNTQVHLCRGRATTSRMPSSSRSAVRDDIFTRSTLSEFELEVRETKRGEEELTSEIRT